LDILRVGRNACSPILLIYNNRKGPFTLRSNPSVSSPKEPGRQTHFGTIHSPNFANLLKFYPHAQTSMQHFYDFFWNADSVHVVSSSSGSWQSYTEYISFIFEATFLPRFAKQEHGCGIPNVLLVQRPGLGSAVSSPSGSGRSPAAEQYSLHFGQEKASDESNFTRISRKNAPNLTRFDLRSFETCVYWRTISTDPLYIDPKQLVTDTTRS